MREQPWHLRRPTAETYRWYRNLTDLHAITTGWLDELDMERNVHLLKRGFSRGQLTEEISSTLWILENLAAPAGEQAALESFFDDSLPEDVLGRLEQAIWCVQAWTLSSLLDQAATKDRTAILNQLEQSTWRSGRDCARARWAELDEAARSDLRAVLQAFRDSPLSGAPRQDRFLVRRATTREISLELRECPHRSPHAALFGSENVADRLCNLHAHWVRGYLYSINTRITVEHRIELPEVCQQRWRIES
jgi:hypothetical protein